MNDVDKPNAKFTPGSLSGLVSAWLSQSVWVNVFLSASGCVVPTISAPPSYRFNFFFGIQSFPFFSPKMQQKLSSESSHHPERPQGDLMHSFDDKKSKKDNRNLEFLIYFLPVNRCKVRPLVTLVHLNE